MNILSNRMQLAENITIIILAEAESLYMIFKIF